MAKRKKEDRLTRIEKTLEKVAQDLDRLTMESEKTRQNIDRLTTESEKTRQNIDRLTTESERTQQNIDRLTTESEKTRQNIDRLTRESEKTRQNIDKLTTELTMDSERFKVEVRQMLKEFRIIMGEFTDGWGKFIEALVMPCVQKTFENKGYKIIHQSQRTKAEKDGRIIKEFDVLTVAYKEGQNFIILTEASSTVNKEEVDKTIEKLERFFEYLPTYKGYNLIGSIAGMRYEKGIEEYAMQKGLYVFCPSGENLILVNPDDFVARIYGCS